MMQRRSFDVDIDVSSKVKKSRYGKRSFVYNEEQLKMIPHPSGFFLDSEDLLGSSIPVDPVSGLTTLESKEGEYEGFFKVDLLTNTLYDRFTSKKEVRESLNFEKFNWDLLLDPKVVEDLPHISKHFSIVRQLQPQSVEDLADILALIRPGKIDLIDDYLKDKERTRKRLYKRPLNGEMYFKKSHAVAYSVGILCYLNKPKYSPFGL